MADQHLRAVIVKVTQGDKVVTSQAFGESLTGVPATTDMHFRNGAVAFAYLGTLLMQFVDEHKVGLDDTIDRWLPDLPEADKVTLKMLANQTSGYPDFETDPAGSPPSTQIRSTSGRSRSGSSTRSPGRVQFAPGTNWSYSHTNFMILGEILAKIGRKPLDTLLREKVLEPDGPDRHHRVPDPEIPSPVLHTFSSERRGRSASRRPRRSTRRRRSGTPQWGTPIGANETTNIDDMTTTAVAVGTGKLLSKSELRGDDRPEPAGLRAQAGQTARPPASRRPTPTTSASASCAPAIVDPAEPAARRATARRRRTCPRRRSASRWP